jgi:hypothetical protein
MATHEQQQFYSWTFFHQYSGNIMADDLTLGNNQGKKVLLKLGFIHDPSINNVFRLKMTREQYL